MDLRKYLIILIAINLVSGAPPLLFLVFGKILAKSAKNYILNALKDKETYEKAGSVVLELLKKHSEEQFKEEVKEALENIKKNTELILEDLQKIQKLVCVFAA
jgi:hypothetical protein